ncbi:anoctamin-7-like [Tachypleus tridentatus]|uniref:anoctamin-7-like n=1 Tax=Tachypleus tridentatus TaxID=6853 RepID=UPI003FD108DD
MDNILQYTTVIDYVLLYEFMDPEDLDENEKVKEGKRQKYRELFNTQMLAEGLIYKEERVGKYVFVKVECPFDRLCKEAETMRLDIPLDGEGWAKWGIILHVAIQIRSLDYHGSREKPGNSERTRTVTLSLEVNVHVDMIIKNEEEDKKSKLQKGMKKMLDIEETEEHEASAPFQVRIKKWFIGNKNEEDFFRPSLRFLLTHNILINIDISKAKNPLKEVYLKKKGLAYLLMKEAFKDAFILHDKSREDKSVEPLPSSQVTPVKLSNDIEFPATYEPPRTVQDTRAILHRQWTGFCRHRQPLDMVRDYFGEKLHFTSVGSGRTFYQGLAYLLMKEAFKDAFILHDKSREDKSVEPLPSSQVTPVKLSNDIEFPATYEPPRTVQDTRAILHRQWTGFCRHRQPLDMVRDYFGEKIAFYFGWVGTLITSLWMPALLGIIVFSVGVARKISDTNNMETGSSNSTQAKKNFVMNSIEVVKNASDNILTPYFAFAICIWGTIFLEVWKRKQATLSFKWQVDNFDMAEPDRPQFYGTKALEDKLTGKLVWLYPMPYRMLKYTTSTSVLVVMMFVVIISVTSVILYRVYSNVSWCGENAKCKMIHGTVIATLLNTISIMILGWVYHTLAFKLTDWENHRTQTRYNDALITKLFAFQFVNTYASLFYTAFFRKDIGTDGIIGLGMEYTDNCGDAGNNNCMSLLSFQLLTLMIIKPVPKFFSDIIIPFLKKMFRRCQGTKVDDFSPSKDHSRKHYLIQEMQKPNAEDFRLSEFNEKIIQYGYLMLFAASFPLAPLLALIINIIDLRVDGKRLLWWNRRPVPFRDNDIGIWFHILRFMNVLGVISNAFLIAFTSEYGQSLTLAQKFLFVIGFEHLVFGVKLILDIIIPDTPVSIQQAKRRERYVVSTLMAEMVSRDSSAE